MANATFTGVVSRDFGSVTAPLATATFVAFRDPEGVNPDGVAWEKVDGVWHCVAWDGDSYGPSDVDDMELELMTAVADGVTNFYFGSNCSREEFFRHMEAPASMFARDDWHYYDFTLDPKRVEEQEKELREALDNLNEAVHMEMYGSSYRA